ncbi:YhcN/YlaJ family sporulation lipoprotein [Radiobacillus sp. PE A8.2]|uniref:YhcN/YlaJ family sporulation lipoprotein n=1 Tax=Radiobacillus sp. PE A8.2 TaxID=3380349 RepID=UPI00388EFA90
MVLKKYVLSFLIVPLLIMAGCAGTNNADSDRTEEADNDLDEFMEPAQSNGDLNGQLGYVNYNKDELEMTDDQPQVVTVNRQKMADTISRMILTYEGFEQVATLVTDDEVLIAYQKPDDLDRNKAASIVKKTGLSILPRFYDIYVSDQAVSFRDIQSLQNSTTLNDNYEQTLENIINDMKKHPQGEYVSENNNMENENK